MADGFHHDYSATSMQTPQVADDSGISNGAMIFGIVILILFILGALYLFSRSSTVTEPTWVVTTGNAATTDTFVGTNFTIYKAQAPVAGTSLTVTYPGNTSLGQEFIIDNSSGSGIVTITGPTVSNKFVYNGTKANTTPLVPLVPVNLASNKIANGNVATFIWISTTTLLRVN